MNTSLTGNYIATRCQRIWQKIINTGSMIDVFLETLMSTDVKKKNTLCAPLILKMKFYSIYYLVLVKTQLHSDEVSGISK